MYNTQLKELRTSKDSKIRELEQAIEDQRTKFEAMINEMDQKIKLQA